jgi:hypothetical protein
MDGADTGKTKYSAECFDELDVPLLATAALVEELA